MDKLIVAEKKGIQIQCFRSGFNKENLQCQSIQLKQGDLLTITTRKKYIIGTGWFVLVRINHKKEEYISMKEIEKANEKEKMLNEIECMLKLANISHYLEQSLASKNKEDFLKYSSLKKELTTLYEKLCFRELIESV